MKRTIEDRVSEALDRLPPGVELLAAAKTRSPDEIGRALGAGVRHVGMNYVQEAASAIDALGRVAAEWHMIGHLQRNKAADAVRLFDRIQSVDSLRLARRIDREATRAGRRMPVLVEINSAEEPQKSGILPKDILAFLEAAGSLPGLQVEGLMTMGPLVESPEDIRPYFRLTKALFDEAASRAIDGVSMRTLSMGMSDSWLVAIEEGATMVRLGTALFGPRAN